MVLICSDSFLFFVPAGCCILLKKDQVHSCCRNLLWKVLLTFEVKHEELLEGFIGLYKLVLSLDLKFRSILAHSVTAGVLIRSDLLFSKQCLNVILPRVSKSNEPVTVSAGHLGSGWGLQLTMIQSARFQSHIMNQ